MADDDEGPAINVRPARRDGEGDALGGGNPFSKPADNPFSAPADVPQSNPFAQPAPPANNPFAQPPAGGQGGPEPVTIPGGLPRPVSIPGAPPATTSIPGAPPQPTGIPGAPLQPTGIPGAPAEEPLALDFGARPSPAAAAPSAEVDEWNKSFNTGEFKLQADSGETDDRSGIITGEFASEEPASQSSKSAKATRAPPRPAAADEGGKNNKVISIVIGAVVLVGLLAVGGKVAYAKLTKKAVVPVAGSGEPDDFVKRMQADAENAPDCWTSDDGYSFVYKAKSGERLKVATIAEVPILFRKNAVCVPEF